MKSSCYLMPSVFLVMTQIVAQDQDADAREVNYPIVKLARQNEKIVDTYAITLKKQ